jgi:hypothetical protein
MEYELEEWLDESEVRPVANLEAPLTVLGGRRWLETASYANDFDQTAELIPEESDVSPETDLQAGLVRID